MSADDMMHQLPLDPTLGGHRPTSGLPPAGTPTGRYLVLLQQDGAEKGMRTLERAAGVAVAFTETGGNRDFLPELGIAIAAIEPRQARDIGIAAEMEPGGIVTVVPERFVRALGNPGPAILDPADASERTPEYWVGYRDGTASTIDQLLRARPRSPQALAANTPNWQDSQEFTWGLQATLVPGCRWQGDGIRVAVLDSGIADHPDFTRPVIKQSFVPNEPVTDLHGHGTHCCGTVAGGLNPSRPLRYGCASGVELLVGKVLSNSGSGREGDILRGIDWAVNQSCAIVSMSLGSPVIPGVPYSTVFETAAYRALTRGCLIFAAAGNDSKRPGAPRPVSHPANCPSILAVGAIDPQEGIASFSNSGGTLSGSGVDLVGPGVGVFSTFLMDAPHLGYRKLNGTSMATPHVAGIAALWAQKTGSRGQDLWEQVIRGCRRLNGPAGDFGAGLVQAPSA